MDKPDVTINLPAEHFSALSEVLSIGLQRANIDSKTRRELMAWWKAEKEFIQDSLDE